MTKVTQLTTLKKGKGGLKKKNIAQWEAHCKKLEAQKKLTKEQKEDLQFRRLQIKRWKSEE